MIPGLLITEGKKRGLYIEFPEGKQFWLGRAPDCDFFLDDPKVSSKHCFFLRRASKLAMKDESSNGTRLNGRKIQNTSIMLKYADILRVGDTHFQVTNLDHDEMGSDLFNVQACLDDLKKRERFPDDEHFLTSLGPYLNIEVIGSGGFSTVYKSVNEAEKKIVALKVFSNLESMGSDFMKRFLREMELLKKLDHPSIIHLYDSGTLQANHKEYHFIALEYFQGIDLYTHLQRYGSMPWRSVLRIIFQIVQALDYMHLKGVLHRDLKPSNLMYNRIKEVTKIIDLGLGKCILDEERETLCVTQPNSSMGTPNYMPIEQWGNAKGVDERADIYALGASAYTLLTNTLPYGSHKNPSKLYRNIVSQNLVPLREICATDTPVQLLEIIEKMMAFEAKDRYPTTRKLMKVLETAAPILKYSLEKA